jgi:histidyl-tRNA synthetase
VSGLTAPKGTFDTLPPDSARFLAVRDTLTAPLRRAGYGYVETPVFEETSVFSRGVGESTDVVTKEMYTFEDRGGDSLTLRPENTASIVRAVITGGLTQQLPLKLFYCGPMFRYERPQKGRLRQFHQIGVELIGVAEPMGDVEIIAVGAHILEALGLGADRVTLELNTLGDQESRQAYRLALVDYLEGHRSRLSEDSLTRLARNPLRILDSKDEGDRAVLADAPLLEGHLNDESRAFYDRVREGLSRQGIAFRESPRLVRGLDYYAHTAFEFTTTTLGAQGTVMAGGRYDGLMRTMGGPDVPGVGWAAGVERLALMLDDAPPAEGPVAIIPIGPAAEAEAWALARTLRRADIPTELAFRGKPGQRMKRADRLGARIALSLGDEELGRGVVRLRDLGSGAEEEVPRDGLVERLRRRA